MSALKLSTPDIMKALSTFAENAWVLGIQYSKDSSTHMLPELNDMLKDREAVYEALRITINTITELIMKHQGTIFGNSVRTLNDILHANLSPDQCDTLNSDPLARMVSDGLSMVAHALGFVTSIYINKVGDGDDKPDEPSKIAGEKILTISMPGKKKSTVVSKLKLDVIVNATTSEILVQHNDIIKLYCLARHHILNADTIDEDVYSLVMSLYLLNGKIPLSGEPILFPLVAIDKDNNDEHRMLVPGKNDEFIKRVDELYDALYKTDKAAVDKYVQEYNSNYTNIRESSSKPLIRVLPQWRWFGYRNSYNKLRLVFGNNKFDLYDAFYTVLPLSSDDKAAILNIYSAMSGKYSQYSKLKKYTSIFLPNIAQWIPYVYPEKFILPIRDYIGMPVPVIGIHDVEDLETKQLFTKCEALANAAEAKELLDHLTDKFVIDNKPVIPYDQSTNHHDLCQITRWLIRAVLDFNHNQKTILVDFINNAIDNISKKRTDNEKVDAALNKRIAESSPYLPSIIKPYTSLYPHAPVITPSILPLVSMPVRKPCRADQIRNYTSRCINIGGPTFNRLFEDNGYVIDFDE